MKELKGKYLMVLIAMCGTIASSIGMIINVSGVFISPVAAEFGTGKGSVSMTLTISSLVFAFGGMATTGFLKKLSFKKMMVFLTEVFAGTTALLSLSPNLAVMYLLCAVRGFAAGSIGMVFSTLVLNNWFYRNNAVITSIAFGCSGIAGAILSPLCNAVIQRVGWRSTYLLLAVITILLNLPAILLPIDATPEKVGMKPYGEREGAGAKTEENGSSVHILDAVVVQVMIFVFGAAFITALPQHFPGIAENLGSPAAGSVMVSAAMVVNTAGKFLVGVFISKLGMRKSLSAYFLLVICGILLLLIGKKPAVLLVSAALIGLSYSLNTVGSATVTRTLFGNENYAKVYPKISLVNTIANALSASVIGYVYDFAGSYQPVFALLIMIAAAGVSMLLLVTRPAAKRFAKA